MKFFAKPNTWFDEGTEAIFLADCEPGWGLFCGARNGLHDEEVCQLDEFEIQG